VGGYDLADDEPTTTAEGDGAPLPTADNPGRVEYWELEIIFRVNYGAEPEAALTDTLLRWMECGDLRPFSIALARGLPIDPAVFDTFAAIADRFEMKSDGGRPRDPTVLIRNLFAAEAYEQAISRSSEQTFDELAKTFGVSHQSIRRAVMALRRAKKLP
jgi:hypothetical protein